MRRRFNADVHTRNKAGRLVSKKKQALGKANPWAAAIKQARKNLGVTGFVPLKKGSPLYNEAMRLYTAPR